VASSELLAEDFRQPVWIVHTPQNLEFEMFADGPPVATSKSPTRGRVKIPQGQTGREEFYAADEALTRRAVASLSR